MATGRCHARSGDNAWVEDTHIFAKTRMWHSQQTRSTVSRHVAQHITSHHITAQLSLAQHITAQHNTHSTSHRSTVQNSASHHSAIQYITSQYSTSQHSIAQHSTSHIVGVKAAPVCELASVHSEHCGQPRHTQGLGQLGLFIRVHLHQSEHAA
jgi:hypothetical protein